MTTKETTQSWRWRIIRVGHNAESFCSIVQVSKSAFSQYLNEKKDPSMKSYNKIEGKIRELEKEKGLI